MKLTDKVKNRIGLAAEMKTEFVLAAKMKIGFVLAALFIVVALTVGCKGGSSDNGTGSTESGAPEATMVYIYHPEGSKVVVEEDRYQLKQPDMAAASIEEIMTVIAPYYEERMAYRTYMLDSENVVTLEFDVIGDYNREYYLLAKGAITRTLYQIADISKIRIVLYNEDEEIISDELLDRDSVYYYDEDTF